MRISTNKRSSNALAENAFVIALVVVLSPCVHKNGFAHAFVLQQLPLYDYDAAPSAEDELLPVAQNVQKDDHSAEPDNDGLKSEQQANFMAMATDTNGTIEKTSVFNNKQQQQQQREKKEATDQGRIHIFAGQHRTNFATTAGQKNEHQNSVEHSTNAQVSHNQSMESLGITGSKRRNHFSHFHRFDFLNILRHKNLLQKIRKLPQKDDLERLLDGEHSSFII